MTAVPSTGPGNEQTAAVDELGEMVRVLLADGFMPSQVADMLGIHPDLVEDSR